MMTTFCIRAIRIVATPKRRHPVPSSFYPAISVDPERDADTCGAREIFFRMISCRSNRRLTASPWRRTEKDGTRSMTDLDQNRWLRRIATGILRAADTDPREVSTIRGASGLAHPYWRWGWMMLVGGWSSYPMTTMAALPLWLKQTFRPRLELCRSYMLDPWRRCSMVTGERTG